MRARGDAPCLLQSRVGGPGAAEDEATLIDAVDCYSRLERHFPQSTIKTDGTRPEAARRARSAHSILDYRRRSLETTPAARADANQTLQRAVEMTLVGKSASEGDLGQWTVRVR